MSIWMSHGDTIDQVPDVFQLIAGTNNIDTAIFKNSNGSFGQPVYGLQFHPEVSHSTYGSQVLRNFLFKVADCIGEWTPALFVHETIERIQNKWVRWCSFGSQ